MYRPDLLPKVRSKKLMRAMRLLPCTTRVSSLYPGHRCAAQNTNVGAHEDAYGKGMATKATDMAVAASCFHCHMIIDRVDLVKADYIAEKCPTAFEARLRQGLIETHALLIDMGIIVISDNDPDGPPMTPEDYLVD